jgi:hypothetical protein
MGTVPALRHAAVPQENRSDHRLNRRYPITLELQYKLLSRGRVERRGFGRTLDMSSNGVLFESDAPLPSTGQVELALDWPFLLDGVCTLKLVMRGRIVRSEAKASAFKAEYHELRTAGVRSRSAALPNSEKTPSMPTASPRLTQIDRGEQVVQTAFKTRSGL